MGRNGVAGGQKERDAPENTLPAFLESKKYTGFTRNAADGSDQSTGDKPRRRRKKDYAVVCEVSVELRNNLERAQSWCVEAQSHPRFANLVPQKVQLVTSSAATLAEIRKALEDLFLEGEEKLNAWWNQKDTDHLRPTQYVGGIWAVNRDRFRLSVGNSKNWTDSSKKLGDVMTEDMAMTVHASLRLYRDGSDKKCIIL